jgi:hypothetical protein
MGFQPWEWEVFSASILFRADFSEVFDASALALSLPWVLAPPLPRSLDELG